MPRNTVISLIKPLIPGNAREARIPALATVKEMNGRELTIGFSLLLPTLVIGFWPKIAINLYESSTNALSQQLTLAKLVGIITPLVS